VKGEERKEEEGQGENELKEGAGRRRREGKQEQMNGRTPTFVTDEKQAVAMTLTVLASFL
jgi:hypothetical protein